MSKRLRTRTHAAVAVALAALAVAGCSKQPVSTQPDVSSDPALSATLPEPGDLTRPPAGSERGFFPLTLGNRWAYRGRVVEQAVFDDGSAFRDERRYRQRDELICIESLAGRPYVVARELQVFAGGAEYPRWIRYRQDRDGLFEADVSTNGPPDCDPVAAGFAARDRWAAMESSPQRAFEAPELQAAYGHARAELMARFEQARRLIGPGDIRVTPRDGRTAREGVDIGELTRLAYPLHVGARWFIRRDPRFVAVVVARRSLELPVGRRVGFKVRIRSELFGPDDRVHFWVSRLGFLQYDIRVVGPITNADGDVIGWLSVRDHRELAGYFLRRPGRRGVLDPELRAGAVASRGTGSAAETSRP